jgi:hypothetical protein
MSELPADHALPKEPSKEPTRKKKPAAVALGKLGSQKGSQVALRS